MWKYVLPFAVIIPLFVTPVSAAKPEVIDYQKHVKPIFQKYCYECHGEKKRKGGLRLTNKRDAFTAADSGEHAIIVKSPEKSALYLRMVSTDEFERMPPEGDRPNADELAMIKKWISQGANWPESADSIKKHWSYISPKQVTARPVDNALWSKNVIDQFLFQKMKEKSLTPNARANNSARLRRVYLALIGLPPTIEQMDAFLNDKSKNAYEKVVDQLLKSPRFGERWASHWLDLARYADSNGFQADQLRDSWAYRDWVINALNADMPFDQFVVEQLAGDLLPNATLEQKIATGFHRTVTCNVEAGVHPEENRTNQVFDRVNTTGTVFLGATFECAQCHNHKYDPITQKEYYQLFSFFNNTPLEVKQTGGVSFDFVGPKMSLPLSAEKKKKREALVTQLEAAKAEKQKTLENNTETEQAWIKRMRLATKDSTAWSPLEIANSSSNSGEEFEQLDDQSILVKGNLPSTTTYEFSANTDDKDIIGFKLEALTHDSLPGKGPGRADADRTNFVLNDFSVYQVTSKGEKKVRLTNAKASFSQSNWAVAGAIDNSGKTGWAIAPQFHKSHWASFRTQKPIASEGTKTFKFVLDQNYGRGRVIGRVRLSILTGDAESADIPEQIKTLLTKEKLNGKEKEQLKNAYLASNPALKRIQTKIKNLQAQIDKIQLDSTLVMVEMDKARETHVMLRGNYLSPAEKVSPGVPSVLHSWNSSWPKNRLGLAKWLTSKENPLIARVTVNRFWAEIFGKGIIRSMEDFGAKAQPASHPELLDWLAVEFMNRDWSIKQIIKLLVMSEAFQQENHWTKESSELDPENIYLSRGPRFRMSAEMIRDNALVASGVLSTKMGGKPIMPHQPSNIWRQVGRNEPKWVEAKNEDRFRRGIYIVWRRAAAYPSFVNFDAPDRAACSVKRPRTNTPLQALTLLNDPTYVELCISLAVRTNVEHKNGSLKDRLNHGVRLVLCREASSEELAILGDFYQERLEYYAKNEKEAKNLLGSKVLVNIPQDLNQPELAAWFCVFNTLLNLDETITR